MSSQLLTRSFLTFALFVTLLFASSPIVYSQGVQTDFDNDGISDFTLVRIQSDKSLLWNVVRSSDAGVQNFTPLGRAGDHLVLANWLALQSPQPGVVTVNSSDNSVVWKILQGDGSVQQKVLGKSKDLIMSGADFNGNGIADAVVGRLSNGRAVWDIALDMFTRSDSSSERLIFGKNGDRAFFVSPDGATDWLGVLGKQLSGRPILKLRNLVSGEVRSFSRLPNFTIGGARPRPFPVKHPSGKDILAFARAGSSSTKVNFLTIEGQKVLATRLPGTGTIVVGNFLSNPGEEIAIQNKSGFLVVNPFDSSQIQQDKSTGVPVDEININNLSVSSEPDSPDNDGTPPNVGKACNSVKGWPGSHIYKTVGSEHFSDIRRNTIGIVIKPGGPGPFPSCITAIDKKGEVVAYLSLYERGNGWEARYYAGIGCGTGTPYNGATVASKARANTGSSDVLFNFGGVCYGPIDASRCIGSSQC